MQKIECIGRLTKDAELRYTTDGSAVATMSLAVDDGYGDSKKTLWIRASLWGKRAEGLSTYLVKGQQVWLEGRLNHEDGNPRLWGDPVRASFEVYITDIVLVGGKPQQKDDDEIPFS